MLSRIADSLFWIARYMERAEDTARILDAHYYMLLEGAPQPYEPRWQTLVAVAGDPAAFPGNGEAGRETVFDFLAFSANNPSSVVQCIAKARENARAIRDRISREMWEDLNGLYLDVSRVRVEEVMAAGPHRFCNLVKFGSHRFHGVTDATLPHDEGWQFLQAGWALERAAMTARIVDAQYHTFTGGLAAPGDWKDHEWMAVLKSVAAYEVYRRRYAGRMEPEKVAELLVLDARHPRSVRFSVAALETALRAVSGAGADHYANEAERLTGKLHHMLRYERIGDILARGLHPWLLEAQRTCHAIGEEIARTYFHYAAAS